MVKQINRISKVKTLIRTVEPIFVDSLIQDTNF